jgi:hypothetical protein
VDDLIAEKGDEASSSQALSEKNQAKLREILSLLQKDVQDQVKDADLLREALALIDQDLPADIKASLEPVSKLDVSYGPPWAHYLGGCRDRLLGGPLGLPGLRYTTPDGVEHKDYGGEVLG